ncbi:hypothetical protein ACFRCX_30780 [Streptomyces sp. NPDC056652]|uniref:hypothetical protein n=1 Tax=Streptomyces sp. NPDC056652 TaxID=3345893 RepID=UPI0036957B60
MSVISPAHTQPREIHLHQLNPLIADQLNHLLDQADEYADHRELTASALLHTQAIRLIGIRPPASGELARCTCENCWDCDTVYDAAHARCYTSLGIEFVQCPRCADEHRIASE